MTSAPIELFDFQINGFGGVDFQQDDLSAAQLRRAIEALARHRTSQVFVTLITDEIEKLVRRLENFERIREADRVVAAAVPGYHLEGPWLNATPGFRGAHPPGPMHAPRIEAFDRLQAAAAGRIRLVTLAPEWPGSAEFIAHLVKCGVHVSLGHTDATEDEIDLAIRAGARFCTHLGNGAPELLPRHNNVIQRLLARDELTACFIPDGVHLPWFVLRNFVRAKPPGKVLFTTDAMAAAGAPPGEYTLGTLRAISGTDGAVRPPNGTGFAGSSLTPDRGVIKAAELLGWPVARAEAVWAASALAFGAATSGGPSA